VFRVYRAWRAKQIDDKLAQNISPYPDTLRMQKSYPTSLRNND